ncbi:MAG: maleate cis-trans isomerase family protein [Janthinobacterium lividum]
MIRLGMLTPSSNTVLEPVIGRLVAGLPGLSVHFSRFAVTEIALTPSALGQFAPAGMVAAARLLADAKVDTIAWNGTSGAWLGFEQDERLCADITGATATPATTSVLAFREAFRALGVRRIGLVTPYTRDVQDRIMSNWDAAGFLCTAERASGLRDNYSFADVPEDDIASMIRATVQEGCDAVAIVCTNLRGGLIAAALEQELGVPVLDSVSVTLWQSLVLAGYPTDGLAPFGRLFA